MHCCFRCKKSPIDLLIGMVNVGHDDGSVEQLDVCKECYKHIYETMGNKHSCRHQEFK